jgi:large subunit ribosomal protein L35
MPKMKSKSAAKKKFKVSGTGKVSYSKSHSSHNLGKKTTKRKRSMRKDQDSAAVDYPVIRKLLGGKKLS